ncbi:trypsin beta-like [Anopheles nili]|uniref:trypsin beta-like n=1 Tax=Anopheles nili TaxID=185578 RepID=UPI00237B2C9C|nr:trypsin beta-like [Anopheles nili]
MVAFKTGPILLLLSLCVAGVFSDEAQDAWASKQRRIKGDNSGRPSKFSGRIVGGTELKNALPYQLSLRESGNHICGASIISAFHALTAAHCQSPPSEISKLTLLAGAVQRSDPNGIIFQVNNVTNHPRFDLRNFANDISILHVTSSFLNYPNLAVIPLVSELYKLKVNSVAAVSGWGLTAADSMLAPTLRTVRIPITSMATCIAQWSPVRIAKTAICAGHPGRDSCNGDSGGPLVQDGQQIGLVSWGADQCGSAYPGIYTYVGNKAMRTFIQENSGV